MTALKRAVKRPSPRRYALTKENIPNIDYLTATVSSGSGQGFDIMVAEVNEEHLLGRQLFDRQYQSECCLSLEHLDECDVVIWHAFRMHQTKYLSASNFWIGTLTLKSHRANLYELVNSTIYRYRTTFRSDRIELLKKLVEMHLADRANQTLSSILDEGKSSLHLFELVYGTRVFTDPRFEAEYQKFDLILKSLHESGDLGIQNGKYVVNGRSLQTISEFEVEDRRHRDSVRLSWILAFLTLILAGAAVTDLVIRV